MKRGPHRVQQGCLAERLEQALNSPAREQGRTKGLVTEAVMNRIEMFTPDQFPLKVRTRHPWQVDRYSRW
jgi:hypothetical protein